MTETDAPLKSAFEPTRASEGDDDCYPGVAPDPPTTVRPPLTEYQVGQLINSIQAAMYSLQRRADPSLTQALLDRAAAEAACIAAILRNTSEHSGKSTTSGGTR